METTSNEILDADLKELKNKPTLSLLSFAIGLVSTILFGYIVYMMMAIVFNKGDIDHNNMMDLLRSRSYLIVSCGAIVSYFVSFICLILAFVRKEKSVFKILAAIGHGFIIFSVVLSFISRLIH